MNFVINLSLLINGLFFVGDLIVAEFVCLFDAKKSRTRKGGEFGKQVRVVSMKVFQFW